MKPFRKILLILVIWSNSWHIILANEEIVINKQVEMLSIADVGYKVSYNEKSTIPSEIKILIHAKDENKAIDSLRQSTFENIDINLAKNSRVYFVWWSDDKKSSKIWSYREKDGKIRIHDTDLNKGFWIDLNALLKLLSQHRNDLKVIE